MTKIIFATSNKDKMKEIREILKGDFQILSSKEAGITADPEENGTTFEENALIKARAIAKESGCLTLADDSGLEVDAMDKQPGIYSARFLGRDTDYTTKNNYIIDQVKGLPEDKRTCRFVCAVAAVWPDGKEKVVRGTIEGTVAHEIRGENGFGYDPIFFLPEYNKTTAELDPAEKNEISHRGRALRMILPFIS